MSLPEERRGSPLWLTVYSDFVTNMVLFFLVLYTATRVTHEKQEEMLGRIALSVSSAEGTALLIEREAERRLEDIIATQNLEEFAMISVDESRIKVVLREAITFLSGDNTLRPESRPVLKEIIDIVRDIPNSIVIEGHTDDVPITRSRRFRSNWELSGARAVSVLEFMTENGVDSERLSAIGYGETRPVFTNETPEGRAMNRRVEITIVRL